MFIGKILRNRYKIVKFLGSGSFGDTYIAEDIDLPSHPECVVKQLKPKTSELEVILVARRLFEREAEVLYRLGKISNQIPKLFAHFEENGEFYLVQEFIDGYDLSAEIIPGSQWSEAEVVKLLQEILQVLTVVHQENIIHRDIKPRNLMRRRHDNKIMLIDFGAVKEIKSLSANTEGEVTSTIAIGSNGYMPNEQANFKPKLCSDIYAVGVIGIQTLTGKLPNNFQEDPHNGEIIWQHEANVSNELANVLSKMVRYKFNERYQTASEALQALISLPLALSKPKASWKLLSRRKVVVATAVGAGILVMFVLSRCILLPTKTDKNFTKLPKLPKLPCDAELSSLPLTPLPDKPDKEFPTGDKFYGSFDQNNKFTGKGILLFKNGDRYDGEFKNDKRDGCGRYSFITKSNSEKYYIGEYIEDKRNGLGRFKWENGDEYRGNFNNDKCEGYGVFIFANGSFKSGIWKQGNLTEQKISCNQ